MISLILKTVNAAGTEVARARRPRRTCQNTSECSRIDGMDRREASSQSERYRTSGFFSRALR